MNLGRFFSELKRRHVYKVAVAYAVVGWLVMQVAATVVPALHLPESLTTVVVGVTLLGFPIALVIAWAFEMTPEGMKRTEKISPNEKLPQWSLRKFVAFFATLAILAAGLLVFRTVRSGAPSAQQPETGAPAESIAVLPFVNMSSDKEQDYFSDGLAEELLNQLAQVPQLRVIARTSSFSFKGKEVDVSTIAQALNVAHVLEGSVRKSANTLRIIAQLIRSSDSSHLWSETYDREMSDVFKVQDEISREVVAALKVKLLPEQQPTNLQRTTNAEAYEQVLIGKEGRRHSGREAFLRSVAAFQRAVELDPKYANAYAGLGQAQAFAADFSPTLAERADGLKQAFASAEKAIALAPDLAAGYWVRGTLRQRLSWDWKGARADFEKATALSPNDNEAIPYAQALFFGGQQKEAFAMDRKATTIDPLSPEAWNVLGWHQAYAGQYVEAKQALQRALELSPDVQWSAFLLGYVALQEGKLDDATAAFRRAPPAFSETGLAMVAHTRGQERESQDLMAVLKEKYAVGFAYQIATACAWRGDKDGAFEWLDHAYEQHDAGLYRLRYDPVMATLRDDPRYATLAKKLGFSE